MSHEGFEVRPVRHYDVPRYPTICIEPEPAEMPDDRVRLRDLVRRAQQAQLEEPRFAAELARWTARPDGVRDGVPLRSSGPRPEPQDEWVLRDFGAGRGRERTPGKDFEPSPLLMVLQSYLDGPAAQVQAGQALQRVWLTLTALGLSASLISQPVEVPEVRADLRRLVANNLPPQAIMRIGYGTPAHPTPRSPVTRFVVPGAGHLAQH
jgi:hypothetical protein